MKPFFFALLPAALLSACDMTIDVTGMLGENERLSGALTYYSDGGTIELFGTAPTHCVGNFSYRHEGRMLAGGSGTMVCDDRRLGPFSFILKDMRHGSGTGTLNGQRYRFSF